MSKEASSRPNRPLPSYLLADVGHANTTVVLLDVVDDAYRFVGRASHPTTLNPPWSNALLGLREAIRQLAEMTGRPLLQDDQLLRPTRADGAGVDHFGLAVSAAGPLPTILVGLSDSLSLTSARRALQAIYATVSDTFSPKDGRTEQQYVAAMLEQRPGLVFVTGGTDGGATRPLLKLVETVGLGLGLLQEGSLFSAPPAPEVAVLFAGNSHLRSQVAEILGQDGLLRVAENVRPGTERLSDARRLLHRSYRETKIETTPGLREALAWSSLPPMPTAAAFATLVQYFAVAEEGLVLGVDVGSETAALIAAWPDHLQPWVQAGLGLGRSLVKALDLDDLAATLAWSPVEMAEAAAQAAVYHKSLHPQTIPMTAGQRQLEQALARAVIRHLARAAAGLWQWPAGASLSSVRRLLVRGGLLGQPLAPGPVILTLLDALQPAGIFTVSQDRYGLAPALGLLAGHDPVAVVQTLAGGALVELGCVIAPLGVGQPGEAAVRVEVRSERLGTVEAEVAYGEIEVIPLPPGRQAEVMVQPARLFDVGFGAGQPHQWTVTGSAAGLVIDARGRPLSLPTDPAGRREWVRRWHSSVGGMSDE
ncbi:MAG: glutamate mutase L [Chloroflexota bacterium]